MRNRNRETHRYKKRYVTWYYFHSKQEQEDFEGQVMRYINERHGFKIVEAKPEEKPSKEAVKSISD